MAGTCCCIYTLILLSAINIPSEEQPTQQKCDDTDPLSLPQNSLDELQKRYYKKFDVLKEIEEDEIETATDIYQSSSKLPCGSFPSVAAELAFKIDNSSETKVARTIYPGVVYIQGGTQVCAGVLISDEWVLTAAECVADLHILTAGVFNFRNPTPGTEKRQSKRELFHDSFNSSSGSGDIGLIQVDSPVDFNDYLRPMCVPSSWAYRKSTKCYLANWGKYNARDGELSDNLNVVPIQLLDENECQFRWTLSGMSVTNTNICGVFLEGGPMCSGDTGGPVVCDEQGVYYVVAVTSSVRDMCSTKFFPEMFTAVASFDSWISKKVREND